MHAIKASAHLSIPSIHEIGYPVAERWHAIVQDRRLPPSTARRLAMEALVPVIVSVFMALMVLLGGAMVGRTTAYVIISPSSSTVDAVTGVDPRDSVVANGWVTPWMERANAPDPSVTP
ncbi:MAG: hypothetical protein IT305_03870 [Chloroflexi bacterium]|nr:hypothetical protein [Chloroflexota bacterium]